MELLGLPGDGPAVGRQLLLALYSMAESSSQVEEVLALTNALALLFISLPVSELLSVSKCNWNLFSVQDSFQSVLYESVVSVVEGLSPDTTVALTLTTGNAASCLLSLMHAFWLHGNMGILLFLPQ